MVLSELKIGQSAKVLNVGGTGSLRQHFLDMGIIPGGVVRLMKFAPMGDPMELRVNDCELTLRLADAALIEVQLLADNCVPEVDVAEEVIENHAEHPGLGEMGPSHHSEDEHPLPKNQIITLRLPAIKTAAKPHSSTS